MICHLRLSQENGTMDKSKAGENRKKILVAAILIPIALLHFVTGSRYQGPYPSFVNGYLLDILIPMGFYLLLCLIEVPSLKSAMVKGILVFSAGLGAEFAQWMGMPSLGQVYDPWDILMYAIGVLLAVILDLLVFPKLFHFWNPNLISE